MNKEYCNSVYIMTNVTNNVLYVGVTSNLQNRVFKHKAMVYEGFTKKYKCFKLVFYENYQYINDAIAMEKQIKRWRREKKIALIEKFNPKWNDLASLF